MAYQAVFKRYEMKYKMTRKQRAAVLEAMLPHMRLDDFGHTTISISIRIHTGWCGVP
jgi:hypothetical protein